MNKDLDKRMLNEWCAQLDNVERQIKFLRETRLGLSHAIAVKAKELRGKRWKQKTVAAKAAISQSHLSQLENYHPVACPLTHQAAVKLINASTK